MASTEPEKIYCLFHLKTDCLCIYPVVKTDKLIERLKNQIRVNEINNRHEPDEELKEKRRQENIVAEKRLADLVGE